MTWNYQIIKHDEDPKCTYYGLHEVYRNKEGKVWTWTKKPSIVSDTFSEIGTILRMMLSDAQKRPILQFSNLPEATSEKNDGPTISHKQLMKELEDGSKEKETET